MTQQIQLMNPADLVPYDRNPRKNDSAVKFVMNSIKRFGFKQPIVTDSNGVIIAGHTRHKAALKLGLKEVPVLIADDLTEEEANAYRIADNSTAEAAEWDYGLLDELLQDISIDMSEFGLELLNQVVDDSGDIVEAEVPDIPQESEPISKKGNMWKLGQHVLLCGDSTNDKDVSRLMGGGLANMCFTDPPYSYEYQSNRRIKSDKFDVLKNDDRILDFMPMVKKYCHGFVFVCTAWKCLTDWVPVFTEQMPLTNMIIWNKGGGGIGDLSHTFSTDYEIILTSNQGQEIVGKRIGSVWSINKDSSSDYVHATQKPVKLSAEAILHTTHKGDTVLDLFGGSGSTLLACEQTGRACRMMELDERYCDVIISRWEAFTGQKAELIEG